MKEICISPGCRCLNSERDKTEEASKEQDLTKKPKKYCFSDLIAEDNFFTENINTLALHNLDLEKLGEDFREKIEKRKLREVELIKTQNSLFIKFNAERIIVLNIDA